MHKVSAANAVNEPGRVGWGGVGKSAALFPDTFRLWLAAPGGEALASDPKLNAA